MPTHSYLVAVDSDYAAPLAAVPSQEPASESPTLASTPDRDAWFDELCRSYRPRLLRYASRCFGPDHAEEIAQETLIRALSGLSPSDREPWPWLRTVVVNVGRNMLRTTARRRESPWDEVDPYPSEPELDPEARAIAGERAALVHRALAAIPPSQRHVLWLHEVDGANCRQIAELLGSSECGVRTQLLRARRSLEKEFRRAGGGVAAMLPLPWARRWLRRLTSPSASSASTGLNFAASALATATALTVGAALFTIQAAPPQHQAVRIHHLAIRGLDQRDVQLASSSRSEAQPAPTGMRVAAHRPASLPHVTVPATAAVPKVRNPIPNKKHVSLVVPTPVGPANVELTTFMNGNPAFCKLPVVECG
jgi:RNA polymerase sigma factor (sigma-70 family)